VRYNLLRLATEPAANPSRTTTLLLLLLALRFHPCRTICCYYFTGATALRACACTRVRGFTPPRAIPVLLTAVCLLRRNNVSARDYARRIAGSRALIVRRLESGGDCLSEARLRIRSRNDEARPVPFLRFPTHAGACRLIARVIS
jgi:hypothetical protein